MEDTLIWTGEDEYGFGILHTMDKETAINILRDLYNEWPGGLEEIDSALRNQRRGLQQKLIAAQQIIRELTELVKKLSEKK